MNVSIVIPAYNEESVIAQTLESLARLKVEGDWEVLLVDNASTDETKAIASKYVDKLPLRIIDEPRKGRGRARATGFSAARGEFVFSTDADTKLPQDWVQKMLVPFKDEKVVGTMSAPIIDDAGAFTNTMYNALGPFYFWLYRLTGGNYPLVGFSFAVRKNIYEQAGGFNPDLLAEEDVDLGQRVAKLGKIAYVSDVRVLTSGRRWQKGILNGVFPYIVTTVGRVLGRHRDLKDVR